MGRRSAIPALALAIAAIGGGYGLMQPRHKKAPDNAGAFELLI